MASASPKISMNLTGRCSPLARICGRWCGPSVWRANASKNPVSGARGGCNGPRLLKKPPPRFLGTLLLGLVCASTTTMVVAGSWVVTVVSGAGGRRAVAGFTGTVLHHGTRIRWWLRIWCLRVKLKKVIWANYFSKELLTHTLSYHLI